MGPDRRRRPAQGNLSIWSFNGSLRDELLNEKIFDTLDDARLATLPQRGTELTCSKAKVHGWAVDIYQCPSF